MWQLTGSLLTKMFWGPRHQRPNFDGFIYIHYAATPYSARISAIYLPFDKVWLDLVHRVQRLATKQNGEFMEGGVGEKSGLF